MAVHRARRRYSSRKSDWSDALGPLAFGLLGLALLTKKPSEPAFPDMPRYAGIPTEIVDSVATSQEQDMWCWAASIQMLLKYYGVSLAQDQIVSRVYGSPGNHPGTDQAISASLNGWGINADGKHFVVQSRVAPGPPTPALLFRELSSGRPILLTFNPGLSVGHAVLVTAASATNRTVVSLVYRDPSPTPVNIQNHGRVELFLQDLAQFLPSVRSHWFVAARFVASSASFCQQ